MFLNTEKSKDSLKTKRKKKGLAVKNLKYILVVSGIGKPAALQNVGEQPLFIAINCEIIVDSPGICLHHVPVVSLNRI